jgi:hypothetical protein
MKLKMFIGPDTKDIERQVNIWRRESPKSEIIKSETTISYHTFPDPSIPDPSGEGQLQQRISIAIWYDDEGGSSEALPVFSPRPPRQSRNSN